VSVPGKAVFFYVLTLLFTILLGGIQTLGGLPAGFVILSQLAPGLAAWAGIHLHQDEGLIRTLFRSQPAWKFAAAGLVPWMVVIVELLIFRDLLDPQTWFAGIHSVPLALLIWIGLGAFSEELGWRGYLQPLLRGRLSPPATSLLVGLGWGLWHLGNYQHGPVYLLFFLLSTIAYSTVITGLLEPSGGNLLLPWLLHIGVNLGYLIFDARVTEVRFMVVHSLLWCAAAGVLILARRKVFFGDDEHELPFEGV
jgi:membrane protease YdiL (CAAX protease family)